MLLIGHEVHDAYSPGLSPVSKICSRVSNTFIRQLKLVASCAYIAAKADVQLESDPTTSLDVRSPLRSEDKSAACVSQQVTAQLQQVSDRDRASTLAEASTRMPEHSTNLHADPSASGSLAGHLDIRSP